MNAVVQCILNSPEQQSSMLESKQIRIIDVTEEGLVERTPVEMPEATVKPWLAQIPMDEGDLCRILQTAQENLWEGKRATREDTEGCNLISFHKLSSTNSPFIRIPVNENSKKCLLD